MSSTYQSLGKRLYNSKGMFFNKMPAVFNFESPAAPHSHNIYHKQIIPVYDGLAIDHQEKSNTHNSLFRMF